MPEAVATSEKHALFTNWVRQYTGELLRFARNRVKDPEVANDLVQLALVSAWETMDRFAGESSPRTWLFAILKHKLADHYRKAYREGIRVSGTDVLGDDPGATQFNAHGHWQQRPDPLEEDENEKLDRALRHCLDALPEHWRSVMEMKYLMEKDSDAIRESMGLSEANYWQQVHRAKLKLRTCIEGRIHPKRA